MAEISAPGPTTFNNYETYNNPGGSQRDANGHDSGSVAFFPLNGTHGVATLDGPTVGLVPTMNQLVRVLPMRGGAAASEASGVSSIQMDGVVPTDGGSVAGGFGVNAAGTRRDGDLEPVDGRRLEPRLGRGLRPVDGTGSPRRRRLATTPSAPSRTAARACSPATSGLYDDYDPSAGTDTFHVLDPLQGGTQAGTWNPPPGRRPDLRRAQPGQPERRVRERAGRNAADPAGVTSNVADDTFSKTVSLTPGLQGIGLASIGGFGQDYQTGTAVVATNDAFDPSLPMRVVTANVKTKQVVGFDGVTIGFPSGVAVDSATHLAVIGSSEGFGVYDLAAQTGVLSTPGGSGYAHPGADDGAPPVPGPGGHAADVLR